MKKQTLLTTAALLILNVGNYFSQQQCKMDSMYYYAIWASASPQQLFLKEKNYYAYNAVGQMTNDLKIVRGGDTSLWVNSFQTFYTYSVSGNTLTALRQEWTTSSTWRNRATDTLEYDSSGKLISQTEYDYNNSTSSWKSYPSQKTTYTYDTQGNLSHMLFQLDSVMQLANYIQYFYYYDTGGNMTSQIGQIWFPSMGGWNNTQKRVYSYNATGQQIQDSVYNWNNVTLMFQYTGQEFFTYAYDSLGNETEKLIQGFATTQILTAQSKYNYFYSCTTDTVGIQSYNKDEFQSVYPNPANNVLNINLQNKAAIEIYSVTGQLLQKQNEAQKHSIDVSSYPSGVYFIRSSRGGSAKFVKE